MYLLRVPQYSSIQLQPPPVWPHEQAAFLQVRSAVRLSLATGSTGYGNTTRHDTTQQQPRREREKEREGGGGGGGGGRTREKEGKRALTKAACRVSGRRALRLDARWRRLERHWLAAGSCARRALAGGGGVGGSAYTYRYIHTGIHSDSLRTYGLKSGERSRARALAAVAANRSRSARCEWGQRLPLPTALLPARLNLTPY